MDCITEKGLKDYLHCFARVRDAAGFLRESPIMGVYMYLCDYKNEVNIYRFKEGDEIGVWVPSEKGMGLRAKKFTYKG